MTFLSSEPEAMKRESDDQARSLIPAVQLMSRSAVSTYCKTRDYQVDKRERAVNLACDGQKDSINDGRSRHPCILPRRDIEPKSSQNDS